MALNTFGTNATSTLTATPWGNKASQYTDYAALAALILNDDNVAHPRMPGAFTNNGLLYVPNRGVLRLQPGDWVAVGSTGFPVLVNGEMKTADFTSA